MLKEQLLGVVKERYRKPKQGVNETGPETVTETRTETRESVTKTMPDKMETSHP